LLSRLGKKIQHFRHKFSRSEWVARRIREPEQAASDYGVQTAGILMIQIDGLGHDQLLKAIDKKRIPFLQRLIQKDHFVLRKFYSGLPSATPAVQAEIFYGVKSSIPAFHYYDRKKSRERVLFDADAADTLARQLEKDHKGLLVGGSSYSNIYGGGAGEASYCIQSMKLKSIFSSITLRNTALFFIANAGKLFRIIGLALLEIGLALVDFFKGMFEGKNPFKEFTFIFSRIGACIVLRELIRLHVKIDIARGLPIIHANFVGYDEHSHRRNPDSAFAMWTLKGIDGTIKELVYKAMRSEKRDYHIFIYSDHGQETTLSYEKVHGRTYLNAIREAFSVGPLQDCDFAEPESAPPHFNLYQRSTSLFQHTSLADNPQKKKMLNHDKIHITAMGPLGHIYLPVEITPEEQRKYGRRLVQMAGIPLICYLKGDTVLCVTREGSGTLAGKAREIFGEDHPFLAEVTEDMEAICRHKNGGDFVISGWQPLGVPLTFPLENGSHGGPGCHETKGFVILPDTAESAAKPYLRGLDLRQQVMTILKNDQSVTLPIVRHTTQAPEIIRVATYNIHSCIGMDGKLFPDRIARIISRISPDIVALQEVDRHTARSNCQDQVTLIAERLGMQYVYFPVLKIDGGDYGLAVLSRFPLEVMNCSYLPQAPLSVSSERRGAMWTRHATLNGTLHLINTHLSLVRKERIVQMRHIVKTLIDQKIPDSEPVLFCGDLNAGINSPVYNLLSTRMSDIQKMHPGFRPEPTFFSTYPLLTLDHMFYSPHLAPLGVTVANDWECRLASDHLPVSGIFLHDPKISNKFLQQNSDAEKTASF
jgi:endonuclease/exonuclease/phosphatase family metal-dependent hydrolase